MRDSSGTFRKLLPLVLLCAFGLALNTLGTILVRGLGLPLFLDCTGTIFAAVVGGYLPAVAVGFLTNLIKAASTPSSAYYGALSVLVALSAAFFAQKGCFRRFSTLFFPAAFFAVLCSGLSSVLTWFLYRLSYGDPTSTSLAHFFDARLDFGPLEALLCADLVINLLDKTLSVFLAALLARLLPETIKTRWLAPPEQVLPEEGRPCRSISLRTKILLLLAAAAVSIAFASVSISFILYRQSTIDEHIKMGQGLANLAASIIDPDRVEDFLALGEDAPGYLETEARLYRVRDSSPDIEYLYVYQIQPDGCHVVFDLDTEDLPGGNPGDLVEFDDAFQEYLPALLTGKPIDPVISNETYGWLLTCYQPVYDSGGVCRCYAAADISMPELRGNEYSFLAKQLALFLNFFLLILSVGFWFAENHVVIPINTMARSSGAFAYNSEEARSRSLRRIQDLQIHTGDEIENLYQAIAKTSEDTVRYIADVQDKTQTITKMQSGLILVLAEMVESRDLNTGQHVRKTAAYVKIIMDQMRKDGVYTAQLTDTFMEHVFSGAPLHDVGKIHVPDAVLNKPGPLTDEEFEIMKYHTVAGSEILSRAIDLVPESAYLYEARNLAAFHHERWDGKGYPYGLSGEEIPLSARIMAVADVFDALVSRRSYKQGFPFQAAIDIIRGSAGTHFDPQVARAFLRAEMQVRQVAASFGS